MALTTGPKPRTRLGSLKKSPLTRNKPTQRSAAAKHDCPNPRLEDDGEGNVICQSCFVQISESNIVADVTFQEDARGAASVQGGFVGENARHARTLGSGVNKRVGGGEKNPEEVLNNVRRILATLCPPLEIPEFISVQATQLYSLASTSSNFNAGRKTEEVVAACLFAACRRQKENRLMLSDITEIQRVNVFRIGHVYRDLCKLLYLDDPTKPKPVGKQHIVDVESLIVRYCSKLEFGDMAQQVAEDAAKIIRRMKRDWMVTGRHPAGLCGACVILAARMNNFRRTVREVVYVAKVADITIAKRVEEFRRTKSAALTVEQFRDVGVRLKYQHDPPVLYESQLKKQKFEAKKRKRQEANEARDNTIEISDDGSNASSRATSVATATPAPELESPDQGPSTKRQKTSATGTALPITVQQKGRRDADGFRIPALPVDPALDQVNVPVKRGPGRPSKKQYPPIIITEEELVEEQELEKDIYDVLDDDEVQDCRSALQKAKDEERAELTAEQQKQIAANKTRQRRQAEGITWCDDRLPAYGDVVTAEELAIEFANDPEVERCILSEEESITKERIWVNHNEDWLRLQREKELMRNVAGAAGRDGKGKKDGKGATRRRKKGKMGDGSTIAEATTPIETAADASAEMVKKRADGNFTKFLDYHAINAMYEPRASTSTGSSHTRSRDATATPDSAGRDGTPLTASSAGDPHSDSASSSPTPAEPGRLQSPPATQRVGAGATSPIASSSARPQPPASPPQTQAPVTAGAEEHEIDLGEPDENDYVQDGEMDYVSGARTPADWESDGDPDDYDEGDYDRAIDPEGDASIGGTFDDEY